MRQHQCNKTIRVIARANFDDPTAPIFKNLKILKINDIYILECLKFIHKQLNTNNLFAISRASEIHIIDTRNRTSLRPLFTKNEAYKGFITYFRCIKWNEFPFNIKQKNIIATFKINTKIHIANSY